MSSTGSEGATQLFALTLYTEACTPCALCSEKSRKCSPPTLTSAQTPSVSIGNRLAETGSILAHALDADLAFEGEAHNKPRRHRTTKVWGTEWQLPEQRRQPV